MPHSNFQTLTHTQFIDGRPHGQPKRRRIVLWIIENAMFAKTSIRHSERRRAIAVHAAVERLLMVERDSRVKPEAHGSEFFDQG